MSTWAVIGKIRLLSSPDYPILSPPDCYVLALPLGLLLDHLLGEPRRWHPLVGFGRLTDWMENLLRHGAPGHAVGNRVRGLVAWALLVLPLPLVLAYLLSRCPWPLALGGHALLVWFALGGRSLAEHARAVYRGLAANDLGEARQRIGWMVSRDTTRMDEQGIAAATIETTLENGNDAVFAVLFWAALLGGPGALAFRFINTLDAMWGYKDARRRYFGWCAARADDGANLLPARLTALTYALFGHGRQALACWRRQGRQWESPNAGPVMAAGAGALGVSLGGPAIYHGRVEERPVLGCGPAPTPIDIERALALVRRGALLWAIFALLAGAFASGLA